MRNFFKQFVSGHTNQSSTEVGGFGSPLRDEDRARFAAFGPFSSSPPGPISLGLRRLLSRAGLEGGANDEVRRELRSLRSVSATDEVCERVVALERPLRVLRPFGARESKSLVGVSARKLEEVKRYSYYTLRKNQ